MPTYTLKFGQSKNLTIVDPHVDTVAYVHPVLAVVGNGAYMSKLDVPVGTPSTNTTYWAKVFEGGMLFKGTYDPLVTYFGHASVQMGNSLYVCKPGNIAAPGESPTSAVAKWHKVMDADDVTYVEDSVLFTDELGSVTELSISPGTLNFNGIDLAFTPGGPNARERTLAVAISDANVNYGTAFIGTDDQIYTTGYYTSNIYHNSISNTSQSVFMPRMEDIPHTGTWKGIFSSYSNLLAWTTTGELYGLGYNGYGQLGTGDTTVRRNLTKVLSSGVDWAYMTGWSDTSNSSYIAMTDVTVKSCGYNGNGQLGINSTSNANTPTDVMGLTGNIVKISTPDSRYAVMFMTDKSGNNLFSCGYNGHGGLGVGSNSNKKKATVIAIRTKDFSISGGYSSYVSGSCIKDDGTLWNWGYGGHYCICNGSSGSKNAPFAANMNGASGMDRVWTVGSYGFNGFCSKDSAGGKIWVWGYGSYGSLGHGSTGSKTTLFETTFASSGHPIKVCCTANYQYKTTFMLTSNGEVWVTGYNGYAQNGNTTAGSNAWKKIPTGKKVAADIQMSGVSQYTGCLIRFTDGSLGFTGYTGHGEGGCASTTNGQSMTFPLF